MTEARKLRVFLCHSSQDKPIVRELYQRLNAEGWIDPWLDEEKLLPGQDWDMEIEKAVEAADAVVVCLSNNSVTKEGYIQRELRYAMDIALEKPEGTIYIVPLRLDDCYPPRKLKEYHYLDYFPADEMDRAYTKLIRSLKLKREKIDPDSIPPEVDDWFNNMLAKSGQMQFAPTPLVVSRRIYRRFHHAAEMEFAEIPAGGFIMGCNEDDDWATSNEMPQHLLLLPYDYYMGLHLVTNKDYNRFLRDRGIEYEDNEEVNWYPVVNVSWYEANEYVTWLNQTYKSHLPEGFFYQLPSEAEWEKAARGVNGLIFPWGNEFDKDKCNTVESELHGITPIGMFSPHGDSPYGITDMIGNVWEWTRSLWGVQENRPIYQYPYNPFDGRENKLAGDDNFRIIRGGSFNSTIDHVYSACRNLLSPKYKHDRTGIRIVISPQKN